MKKKLLSLILIATCTSYVNAAEEVVSDAVEHAAVHTDTFFRTAKESMVHHFSLAKAGVLNCKNRVYSDIKNNPTGSCCGAILGFETVEWILNHFNCCKDKRFANYAARMVGAAVGSGLGAMYAQNKKYKILLALAAVAAFGANHHDLIEDQLN